MYKNESYLKCEKKKQKNVSIAIMVLSTKLLEWWFLFCAPVLDKIQ